VVRFTHCTRHHAERNSQFPLIRYTQMLKQLNAFRSLEKVQWWSNVGQFISTKEYESRISGGSYSWVGVKTWELHRWDHQYGSDRGCCRKNRVNGMPVGNVSARTHWQTDNAKTLGTKINVFEMNKLRKKTIKLYACNCRFIGNIGLSYTCELFSWICLIVSK